jgi:signal transduction histidine kinase
MPVEEEWRPPTVMRSAQYAGIGSGSYRFEIQTVSPSGSVSSRTAMVEFDIQAPFWRAGWFLVLLGAFLAALVFAAHLYRVRHLLALERVRAHLAADLHDDLGSGLAEIAILTEVAKRHGNAEELEVVAQRARELRSAMGDIVWSVDPEYDNLDGLIRRWRQTAFALLGNESLEFEAPASELTAGIELNPERRRHLLLLFKEVVTNVARHAQGGSVRIKVWLSPAGLNLEVRDDGCGFRTETAHSGSGLKNIVKRADALGASIRIQSQPGSGTAVSLTAPFEA